MVSDAMKPLLKSNSAIRAMFEEGKRLASEFGQENVYDFSLGNPNVPVPEAVNRAILDIVAKEPSTDIHGYMSNAGFTEAREAVAGSLNRRFGTEFGPEHILMTVGAAGGMNVILKTILNPGDEVIVFAPYFMEYGSYVRNYGGMLKAVPPDTASFQPRISEFRQMITKRTKAVIINTPNNPTGVIYSEEVLKEIGQVMREKEKEFGRPMVLISDEPYRELVYDGVKAPFVTPFYHNAVVCYSYSKSLSLPGERIGYLVIPGQMDHSEEVMGAAIVANRIMGYVNAPSLFQKVIARCADEKVNGEAYDKNRLLLYRSLTEYGFDCVYPAGAFYLFVRSPEADDVSFCKACKRHRVLLVPGSAFGCPGFVRVSYCVSYEQLERSLPAFRRIAGEYGLM